MISWSCLRREGPLAATWSSSLPHVRVEVYLSWKLFSYWCYPRTFYLFPNRSHDWHTVSPNKTQLKGWTEIPLSLRTRELNGKDKHINTQSEHRAALFNIAATSHSGFWATETWPVQVEMYWSVKDASGKKFLLITMYTYHMLTWQYCGHSRLNGKYEN